MRTEVASFSGDRSTREKIDLVPMVDRAEPAKVVGVVTGESVSYAIEKAKSLR